MTSHTASVGPLVEGFFLEYLLRYKRASPQTISAYRDTFRLLLAFLSQRVGRAPAALRLADFDAPAILAFLDHLERDRQNTPRSRNARLAAIRSFARYVALRDPASLALVTRVLAIPRKRADRRLVGYLTRAEMDACLAAPGRARWAGRRDHALLLTLYNSGARVSELAALRRSEVVFGASSAVQLHGKGRKDRVVPLWPRTARVLQTWFRELAGPPDGVAFPNARGGPLTRHGITYRLRRALARAARVPESRHQTSLSPRGPAFDCHAPAASRGRARRDRALARARERGDYPHVRRGRSHHEGTCPGATTTGRRRSTPFQGRRRAPGLPWAALIMLSTRPTRDRVAARSPAALPISRHFP